MKIKATQDVHIRSGEAKRDGDANIKGVLQKGFYIEVVETKNDGEEIDGNSAWYKDKNGDWYWSGGFEEVISFEDVAEREFQSGHLDYSSMITMKGNKLGKNVMVGILDTKIQKSHEAFSPKFKDSTFDEDILGSHGTMVAGLIGGSLNPPYSGFSPNSEIIECGIFKNSGFDEGDTIRFIEGFVKLKKEAEKSQSNKLKGIVLNISQSIPSFQFKKLKKTINDATKEIIIVASAGEADSTNQLKDNLQNPASESNVIAVGTVSSNFQEHNALDFSSSLDYLLPSFRYKTPSKKSNSSYNKLGKDSAACAVVTGLIANLISSNKLKPFPHYDDVIKCLDGEAKKISDKIDLQEFQIYKP